MFVSIYTKYTDSIDSNVWLSVYHYSKNDLDHFEKLLPYINDNITLLIPQQVKDEFDRNRENKIIDALKQFEFKKLSYPGICKSYNEYQGFLSKHKELYDTHKEWLEKIRTDVERLNTPADKMIKQFFDLGSIISIDEEIVAKAQERHRLGNPPGKTNSLGDAINWESLLKNVPMCESITIVSDDKDYKSLISPDSINPFLNNEWYKLKASKIKFFTNMADFLKSIDSEIDLRDEKKKNDLIEGLLYSHNFTTTHSLIESLSEFDTWSLEQVDNLCKAAVSNTQVNWILRDADVLEFYTNLINNVQSEVGENYEFLLQIKEELHEQFVLSYE